MMSTTERLNDQLAELKTKRDKCSEHIKNMLAKIHSLQGDLRQSETDYAAWQAAIDELEELEDYMVGEEPVLHNGKPMPGAQGPPPQQPPSFPPPPPVPPMQMPMQPIFPHQQAPAPQPHQPHVMGPPPHMPDEPRLFHYPHPTPPAITQIQTMNEMMQLLMQEQENTDKHIALLVSHHQAVAAAASCATPPGPMDLPAAGFPAPRTP